MAALRDTKDADARGMELDARDVATAVARGLSVVQGDADTDLADYPDGSFDYAILSQTLQTTKRPDLVLDHLVRIGRQAFVSFPNFAQWRMRLAHMFGGRMPVTEQLPHSWYDTPNIHHVTIDDFRSFLDERNIRIEGQWFLSGDKPRNGRLANLLAEHAVFLLRRD
jgi:methionine biosynthesis protein MetW